MNPITTQAKRRSFLPIAAPAALGALSLTPLASHAAIDVTSVVTEINGLIAPLGLIGGAVLIVVVTIAAYRWIRRAIS